MPLTPALSQGRGGRTAAGAEGGALHFPDRGGGSAPTGDARSPSGLCPACQSGRGRGGSAPTGDARSPSGLCPACQSGRGRGAAPPQGTRARPRGCVPPASPDGGVGLRPHRGRALALRAVSRLPVRTGAWGLRPHRDARSPSGLCPACQSGWGRGGCAPTERKSEGGWVGQSGAQRVLVRDGGVGGAAPRKRDAFALGGSLALGSLACRSPPPSPQGEGAGGSGRAGGLTGPGTG